MFLRIAEGTNWSKERKKERNSKQTVVVLFLMVVGQGQRLSWRSAHMKACEFRPRSAFCSLRLYDHTKLAMPSGKKRAVCNLLWYYWGFLIIKSELSPCFSNEHRWSRHLGNLWQRQRENSNRRAIRSFRIGVVVNRLRYWMKFILLSTIVSRRAMAR